MIRSFAGTSLRSGALRARLPKSAPMMAPSVQQFHSGERREEEAKTPPALSGAESKAYYAAQPLFMKTPDRVRSIIDSLDLGGTKRLVPLALFLAIPALSREWYVITEETMLMGCFGLFLGAAVDFGGASVAKYFKDQADSIKATHNELEDAQVKVVQAELDAHKARLGEMEEVQTIYEIQVEASKKLAEAKTLMEAHKHRDTCVKILESLKAARVKHIADLRAAEVAKALEVVQSQVEADKKLKKAALENALSALTDPAAAAAADPVSKVFARYWSEKAAEMEKNKDQPVALTKEQIEDNVAEAKAIFSKWGGTPSTDTPKTYKPSDSSLFY